MQTKGKTLFSLVRSSETTLVIVCVGSGVEPSGSGQLVAVSVTWDRQEVIVFFLVILCWSCELPQNRPLTLKKKIIIKKSTKKTPKVFSYSSSSWSKY